MHVLCFDVLKFVLGFQIHPAYMHTYIGLRTYIHTDIRKMDCIFITYSIKPIILFCEVLKMSPVSVQMYAINLNREVCPSILATACILGQDRQSWPLCTDDTAR
jgi:hypothetical protein